MICELKVQYMLSKHTVKEAKNSTGGRKLVLRLFAWTVLGNRTIVYKDH